MVPLTEPHRPRSGVTATTRNGLAGVDGLGSVALSSVISSTGRSGMRFAMGFAKFLDAVSASSDRRSLADATIFMALVIFLMLFTATMRMRTAQTRTQTDTRNDE